MVKGKTDVRTKNNWKRHVYNFEATIKCYVDYTKARKRKHVNISRNRVCLSKVLQPQGFKY
ncbi:hypothetical protein OUZ56_007968 [Daphnia magna]|uniref:Uncharacterized protein n=1 Tax=Daphnia magna TaxID=35525 RepID=A0ABR0ABI5_9CRUS|nr:hypothetical protein OUZ56_007968 [Daphnia magna]